MISCTLKSRTIFPCPLDSGVTIWFPCCSLVSVALSLMLAVDSSGMTFMVLFAYTPYSNDIPWLYRAILLLDPPFRRDLPCRYDAWHTVHAHCVECAWCTSWIGRWMLANCDHEWVISPWIDNDGLSYPSSEFCIVPLLILPIIYPVDPFRFGTWVTSQRWLVFDATPLVTWLSIR